MGRNNYRNGDEITLGSGCDGCSPSMINGVLCHETGCLEAWRDYRKECKWCGGMFYPGEYNQVFCNESCAECFCN